MCALQQAAEIALQEPVVCVGCGGAEDDDDVIALCERLALRAQNLAHAAAQAIAEYSVPQAARGDDAEARGQHHIALAAGQEAQNKKTPCSGCAPGAYHGELGGSLHGLTPLELHRDRA